MDLHVVPSWTLLPPPFPGVLPFLFKAILYAYYSCNSPQTAWIHTYHYYSHFTGRETEALQKEVICPSLATQYWKGWIMKPSELHVCSKSLCYTASRKRNLLKSTEKLKITGRPGDPGLELRATSVSTPQQPCQAQTTLQGAPPTLPHTGPCLQNAILLPQHHHPGTIPHCPTSARCRVWKGVNIWWNHDHKAGRPGQQGHGQVQSPQGSEVHGVHGVPRSMGWVYWFPRTADRKCYKLGGLKQREIYSLDSLGSQEPKDCFHLAILGEKPFHTFLLASGGCGQPPHCLGLQTHHSNPSPTFTWTSPLCLCLFVVLLRASAVLDAGPIQC